MAVVVGILVLILAFFLLGFIFKILFGLALLLVVALLCGWAAQSLLKYPGGLTTAFLSGLIGGVLGWILVALTPLPSLVVIGGLPVVWTLVGAVVVVALAKLGLPAGRRRRLGI
ncbi:MAG: hypothetical protein U0531_18015 [Dehalococcoidia bacterium]